MAQILDVANRGVSKTRIMYRAYLSYYQLNEYLSFLVSNGLLEFERTTISYKTTEKGFKFLRLYTQMADIATKPREIPAYMTA